MNAVSLATRIAMLSQNNQDIVDRLVDALLDNGPAPPTLDFDTAYSQWVNNLLAQRKRPRTIAQYSKEVRDFLSQFPDPGQAHLDAFISLLPSTSVHHYVSAIRSFFSFCNQRGFYPNITTHLKTRYKPNRRQPASQDTVTKLLSLKLNTRHRCILVLFIDTGIRLSELASIELSNITKDTLTITGKRNKTRTVYLTPFAAESIAAHRATLPPDAIYLFHTSSYRHVDTRSIQKVIANLCKRAGVPHTSPHQFRHYWTSHMLESGASLKTVSSLLGHSKISTTADVYWHLSDPIAKEQALNLSPSMSLGVVNANYGEATA